MTLVIVVVLTDINGVTADTFDPHSVAKGSDIPDGDRMDFRRRAGWDAGGPGIARPLVGITTAAPVRHVAEGLVNFPGGITDAFAVVHSPAIQHAVLRRVA